MRKRQGGDNSKRHDELSEEITINRKEIARISVKKKALKIDELGDKVKFAVDAYKRAFDKYQRGVDSIKDWGMVIKALKAQAGEIKEYIAVAHHNTGVIYASSGNYTMAIESFTEALEYNPDYAVAHNNLSIVYKKLGDVVNADKHLQHARRLGYKPQKKAEGRRPKA